MVQKRTFSGNTWPLARTPIVPRLKRVSATI
jgi:hypothetical protein